MYEYMPHEILLKGVSLGELDFSKCSKKARADIEIIEAGLNTSIKNLAFVQVSAFKTQEDFDAFISKILPLYFKDFKTLDDWIRDNVKDEFKFDLKSFKSNLNFTNPQECYNFIMDYNYAYVKKALKFLPEGSKLFTSEKFMLQVLSFFNKDNFYDSGDNANKLDFVKNMLTYFPNNLDLHVALFEHHHDTRKLPDFIFNDLNSFFVVTKKYNIEWWRVEFAGNKDLIKAYFTYFYNHRNQDVYLDDENCLSLPNGQEWDWGFILDIVKILSNNGCTIYSDKLFMDKDLTFFKENRELTYFLMKSSTVLNHPIYSLLSVNDVADLKDNSNIELAKFVFSFWNYCDFDKKSLNRFKMAAKKSKLLANSMGLNKVSELPQKTEVLFEDFKKLVLSV